MKRVHVAPDGWNFQLEGAGEPVTPIGGNVLDGRHPGQGTLFQQFDAADCDRRLGLMADLGLNCLRQPIGVNEVFEVTGGLKREGLKNWDAFMALAEKHGIWLMPVGGYLGGNDWFDVERLADHGAQLDAECRFWSAFAGHFRGHPAIWAWDLRNELLYDTKPHAVAPGAADERRVEAKLKEGWPAWLEEKYGTVAEMNRAHGSAWRSFADAPGSVRFEEAPFDRRACDFRRYLEARGREWCRRQCRAIRESAPGHMVVQGNNGWLAPDMDLWLANGFPNRALHDLFDFVTFHPYPAWQAVPGGRGDPLDGGEPMRFWLSACIGMARLDHYGKPVVVQEFGWYGGGASRFLGELPWRSEREHADYTRAVTDALIPHVNGFLNWPTFDMPAANDISNHGGIFASDGRRKELAGVYADLSRRLVGQRQVRARGTVALEYPLEGLLTSRGLQDRLWEEVHAILRAGNIPDFCMVEP